MERQPLVIKTERDGVLLKQSTEDDLPAFRELIARNVKHIDWSTKEQDIRKALRSNDLMSFGIWHSDELVGYVYLYPLPADYHAEIGYWIDADQQGKGLTTVAVKALAECAFTQLEYWRLTAIVKETNSRSKGVLERVGFRSVVYTDGWHTYARQANESL